jgi:Tfp pilus assembly protein PilF
VEQGKPDEAIAWFEQAKRAPRYEPRHFPYLNLGRLRAARGEVSEAVQEFEGALQEAPGDAIALRFLEELRYKVN